MRLTIQLHFGHHDSQLQCQNVTVSYRRHSRSHATSANLTILLKTGGPQPQHARASTAPQPAAIQVRHLHCQGDKEHLSLRESQRESFDPSATHTARQVIELIHPGWLPVPISSVDQCCPPTRPSVARKSMTGPSNLDSRLFGLYDMYVL
jgi:hypothetical protein